MASSLKTAEDDYLAELRNTSRMPLHVLPHRMRSSDALHKNRTREFEGLFDLPAVDVSAVDVPREEAIDVLSRDLASLAKNVDDRLGLIWLILKRTPTASHAMFDDLPPDVNEADAREWNERCKKSLEKGIGDIETVTQDHAVSQPNQWTRAEIDERFKSLHTILEEQQERIKHLEGCLRQPSEHNTEDSADDERCEKPSQIVLEGNIELGTNMQHLRSSINSILDASAATHPEYFGDPVDDLSIDSWRFQGSCWDAAAFLGYSDIVLPLEACFLLLLFLMNVGIQMAFVIIVWLSLTESLLDHETIKGFHDWRTQIGHSIQVMNALTGESLASRVCRGDSSLHVSERQAAQIQDIDAYLNNHWPFNGPLLCFGALVIWTLTVCTEFQVVSDMMIACFGLPKGQTVIAYTGSGQLTLQSISTCRLCYISSLCLFRATLATALLIAGAKYLALTPAIEDIMLNAVALAFVLDVDELLFAVMAPFKTRRLILLLQPLRVHRCKSFFGLDARMLTSLITMYALPLVAAVTWMRPLMRNMNDAEDEICAGRLDWSYTMNADKTLSWSHQPKPRFTMDDFKETTRYRVLRGLVVAKSGNDTFPFGSSSLRGPGKSVANFAKWDIGQLGENFNNLCRDLNPSGATGPRGLASLRDDVGNQSIATCADVASYCNDFFAGAVRMWCPTTCQCDRFNASLSLPYAAHGCPSACMHSQVFNIERAAAPCVQFGKDVLASMKVWQDVIANRLEAISRWQHPYQETAVTQLLQSHGCDARGAALAMGRDICKTDNLRPVVQWCPHTCQCNITLSAWCPRSCLPNTALTAWLSTVGHYFG